MAEIAIGIDLGTSNSCVAVARGGNVEVLANGYGESISASVVAFQEEGAIQVGNTAKANVIHDPIHTVSSAKRLIGRFFFSEEVKKAQAICSYKIIEGPNHSVRIGVRDEQFSLPEISAMVLREMKSVAEEQLGQEVRKAVITVPAYFNDNQRQATKDAGRIAGLEVLRLLNEPTAAALAYGFGRGLTQRVAVYDLGGGTFDISILEMSDGVVEVIATAGNTFLGGEDFDRRIVEHLLDEFQQAEGIDLRGDAMALQRLKDAAEKAKCDLSARESAEINLPFIASDDAGPRHLSVELSRDTLESLVHDIVEGTLKTIEDCMGDAGISPDQIDQVILVGGQTRTPLVQNRAAEYFGKRPHKGVNPDEVVAIGAAIQGETLTSEEENPLLLDVTPLSLGIATFGGHFARLIERNTTVPVCKSHVFTTTRDNQSAVKIRVLQGESETAAENDLLGEFVLGGIRPARKGEPEIDVSFDIDANGIVSVSARDTTTGKKQSITVNATGTLSDDEIQQIIEEQELYEVQLKE